MGWAWNKSKPLTAVTEKSLYNIIFILSDLSAFQHRKKHGTYSLYLFQNNLKIDL